MLQILFSEWIVRFFLLYLLVVGAAVLILRPSPVLASPLAVLSRIEINARWAGRWKWRAASHVTLLEKFAIRIGYRERGDFLFSREP